MIRRVLAVVAAGMLFVGAYAGEVVRLSEPVATTDTTETFGSVLDRFREPLLAELRCNEELHHSLLAAHFNRHLKPFCHPVATAADPGR